MYIQCPYCETRFYGWSPSIKCKCGWEHNFNLPEDGDPVQNILRRQTERLAARLQRESKEAGCA